MLNREPRGNRALTSQRNFISVNNMTKITITSETKHERILHAETQAARFLGNYNEEIERGAVKTAAKSLEKAQRWLDRANDLSGRGSE